MKHFTLTHVVYDENDPFGFILSLITLSPVYIVVMYVSLILFRRDLHTISLLLGQLLNWVLNSVLKQILRQPRPKEAVMGGYGMPSAHSQFMSFFATYMLCFLYFRMGPTSRPQEKLFVALIVCVLSLLVSYSRIHLRYHSTDQVIVANVIGFFTAIVWFCLVQNHFNSYFRQIEQTPLASFFLLRDTTHVPDLIQFEYDCVRGKQH